MLIAGTLSNRPNKCVLQLIAICNKIIGRGFRGSSRFLVCKTRTAPVLRCINAAASERRRVAAIQDNPHRRLDPWEFRELALSDDFAAQKLTSAHEMACLWFGKTALSNSQPDTFTGHEVESWRSRVAAEFLVPMNALRQEYRRSAELPEEIARLAHRFKLSRYRWSKAGANALLAVGCCFEKGASHVFW